MTYAMKLNGGALVTAGKEVPYAGVGDNGWKADVISDGTSFGNPETLTRTITTLMTAGSWDEIVKFLNREPQLTVEITGDTADGLNAGEVWLSSLMGPGTLEWLPPGQSVWTVFDLTQSYIKRSEDDAWDVDDPRWVRRFNIPIKALPYARSPELTITPAEPTAATPIVDTLINDGSAITGYSAQAFDNTGTLTTNITPTTTSGRVRASRNTPNTWAGEYIRLRYAIGSAIPTATPYLRVDWRANLTNSGNISGLITESSTGALAVVAPARSTVATVSAGLVGGTNYYRVPVDTVAVTVESYHPPNQTGAYVEVDQLRRLSRLPDLGTNRQKLAAIIPGGSAPADGSLHVTATAALGRVLVHTYPLGRPSPALMQYKTAGDPPTSDTTCINGERTAVYPTQLTLTVPDSQLPTRGRATLWAKMRVDTASVTLRWTVTPSVNGTDVGQAQTKDVTIPVGTSVVMPIGLINLGAVTGPAGAHTFTFLRAFGSGNIWIDEVWAFGKDDASALTVVEAGTGTVTSGGASNHLWINAPSPTKRAGEVLIGTSLSDARWASTIQSGPQVHKFPSKGVSVLVVTCNATDASTDFTHFKRWTHHAAQAS